jgi:hypothetical protein
MWRAACGTERLSTEWTQRSFGGVTRSDSCTEVRSQFMRTNAAQIASVEASAKPTKGVGEEAEAPEGSGWHMAVWSEDSRASALDLFPSQWCLGRPM